MVHKIDENNYYVYTNPKKVNSADKGEKFSLNYEKEGMQAESKEKKEVSDQEKKLTAEQNGVRIELSGIGVERQKQTKTDEHHNTAEFSSFLDSVRKVFNSTVAAIKDFLGRIWGTPERTDSFADISEMIEITEIAEITESAESAETSEMDETAELEKAAEMAEIADISGSGDDLKSPEAFSSAADMQDRENNDDEIRRYFQNGDMEQVFRLLTDNGRRTAARNSTLLTFYDKNGRVVKPDASVQQRTLYGDKNTRKL